jgi:hypothetical protein
MIIKKLEIGYGGVLTSNYEIVKNGRELVYRFGKHFPINEQVRVPAHLEWLEFAHAIMPILKQWKKEYYNETRNGIQWKVSIETTDGYFYSCGSNEFPENFQTFLFHCRNIIRSEDFASDFRASYGRAVLPMPLNAFNRKILRLLKAQRKTIRDLAEFLDHDIDMVKAQLRSTETFRQEDLTRICAFFNELPTDFLFETSPEPYSSVVQDIQTSSTLVRQRIRETQRLIIDYFDNTFVVN